jgi:hypothetical protein
MTIALAANSPRPRTNPDAVEPAGNEDDTVTSPPERAPDDGSA